MITDVNFPIIHYPSNLSAYDCGFMHGKSFSKEIKELAKIRKELMLAKNPLLENHIEQFAKLQWNETSLFDDQLIKEARGICDGANISIEDFVILNNYTDFRDIQLSDEGCTSISIHRKEKAIGQTWDMHSSAQNYICIIQRSDSIVFSLVGCLGMMGINNHEVFFGVNNINTTDAKPGILWPALVRKALSSKTTNEALHLVKKSKVTSGHNYLIGDKESSLHIEKTPTKEDIIDTLEKDDHGFIYHTNHCLGENVKEVEDKNSISSTTHNRESILLDFEKNSPINTSLELIELLKDHTGHPKSICSHFQSGAQDPSQTCGGGVYNYSSKEFHVWRGCPKESNYIAYDFQLNNVGEFCKI
tara:strand:+ start:20387 stop:21466 length:1080 start_codon:yes stop_codon:yes gene_type:complete